MPIPNYPNGFSNGVNINGTPLFMGRKKTGKVFWVDSTKGSNNNKGDLGHPFATIDYAVGRCTDNNGDIICVAAGHTESVIAAGTLTIDVDGITIIFKGDGTDRGTIEFGTSTAAQMIVSAANTTLINPKFVTGLDAIVKAISIEAAYCYIENASFYDAASKATTIQVGLNTSAINCIINGYKFFPSSAGTQKTVGIQANGSHSLLLNNIDITGDFSTANIDNSGNAITNLRLENIKLKNENTTPKPGIVLQANTTGQAKNVDIRIDSGSTYVSNLAKMNWDIQCLGYSADGTGGDPIGTAGSGTIEAKIDAIQADIGDPSSRTNFQNLEDMIGIPDAANSCLDNMLRSGFDSTSTSANQDGSIMERLEFLQSQIVPDMGGLVFGGSCDTGMTGSTTTIVAANLAGYGDDYFNTKYYMQIIKNDNSAGNAPEREVRQITDYVSSTGTFTVTAFTVNVEEDDSVLVIHESLIMLGRDDADNTAATTNIVANEDGSILERLEQIQEAVNVGTGTSLASNKSLVDALGTDGTTVTDGAVTVLGAIGANNNNNAFDSSTVVQNADGSVLERLEYLQNSIIPDLGGAFFSGSCDSGMTGSTTTIVCSQLAGYTDDFFNTKYYMQIIRNANSVGNAPERQIRLITDYVSSTGTFTTNAFGANVEEGDAILIMHESYVMIGRDDADNIADTSNVVANADGSMLERQEYIQTTTDTINTNVGDPSGDTLTTLTAKLGDGATTMAADFTTLKTDLGDPSGDTLTSVVAKLGDGATTVAADMTTLKTNLGDPSGDTLTSITAKLGDGATTMAADFTTVKGEVNKIDSATLAVNPTANSLAAFIASGGTALGSELSDSKSLVDAIGSDGTTLYYGSGSTLGAIGTEFWVKKTLVSSNITQAGVDVTGTSSGELSICQIVLKTDSTGLAGGTNKVVYCDNTNGEPDILTEAVGNLGANATVTLETASVSGCGTILESGKKIIMRSTVADGTGAGTVDVYLKCQRLSAGATLAAA